MTALYFIVFVIASLVLAKFYAKVRMWYLKSKSYEIYKPKIERYNKQKAEFEGQKEKFEAYKKEVKTQLQNKEDDLVRLAKQKSKGFPWLAKAYADYFHLDDLKEARHLKTKKRPAIKTAEKLKKVSKEKRNAEEKYRIYKYIVEYYERLFPFLTDFREIEDDELIRVEKSNEIDRDKSDRTKNWLAPEEYKKLPTSEKNQLALDRYRTRQKSNWEIGRDYERYVGYYFENKGWKVDYQGILKGYEDLGRDLVVHKNGHTSIIQCKYWSKRKTIHEKHVFQLFGTTIEYFLKNYKLTKSTQLNFFVDLLKGENVNGVFITNIELSEMARKVADALNIDVWENFDLKEYPIIKCNIAQNTGEKIYHLPLDQQYDNVKIIEANGDRYISTVEEAENLGFRRAFRWTGNKTNK